MLLRLLLAVPILYVPNALHFPDSSGFIPGLNATNLMFLASLLAIPLLARADSTRLPGPARLTAPMLALFASLGLAFLVAQLFSRGDVVEDLTYLKSAIFYPLFYLLYRNSRLDLRGTRQLIILVMVVAAVAGVEAIREGLDYGVVDNYSLSKRASGPFGADYKNANRAGVFYAMFLPMFVALALFLRKQTLLRWASLAGCVILALAIMATFSRQSYLIALLCLMLVALRRSIVVAVLIGVVMVASVDLLPASVTQRVQETEQTDSVGTEQLDVSTTSRFDIWTGALDMWRDHPAGVGLNRFKRYIGNYSAYEGFDAHNFYVLTFAEGGPLALACLLWLMWRLAGLARLLLRSAVTLDAEAKALATGFALVVLAMALSNVYGSPFLEGSVMANFWVLCGLVERYDALKRTELAKSAAIGPEPKLPAPPQPRFPLVERMQGQRSMGHRSIIWMTALVSLSALVFEPASAAAAPTDVNRDCNAGYSHGFARVAGKVPLPVAPVPRPAKGKIGFDPVFHTCVIRATDHRAERLAGFARTDYSRRQAFNADNSRFIVYSYDGGWHLYDANTLAHIRALDGPGGDAEPQWDASNRNSLYYVPINGGLTLRKLDVNTNVTTVAANFTSRLPWRGVAHVWTRSEGSPSADGRYWCFMAENSSFDILGVFTYDLYTQTITGTRSLSTRPDHVSMSASGRYCVVSSDSPVGTYAWNRTFTRSRRLHTTSEHSDLAIGANGNDVFVFVNYGGDTGDLMMVDLDTGVRTSLFPTYIAGTATAYHISGKAFSKPGWVLMSTYASYGGPKKWLHERIMAVQLKANPTVISLAQHRSIHKGYWTEPQATISRDFSHALFNSNWGKSTPLDVDTYMLRLPDNVLPVTKYRGGALR